MRRWLAAAMCSVSVVACSPGGSTPESATPSTDASTSRFTSSSTPGSKPATGKGVPSPSEPQTGRVRPKPGCFGVQATILGTRLHDRIRGTDGNDVVVSLGGDDVVSGLNEKDIVCTGSGNDRVLVEQDVRVDLGPGDDAVNHVGGHGGGRIRTIRGGAGDDTILLSRNSEASVVPGPGDDRIRAVPVRGEPSRTPCVRFESATGPVRVNLALGRATGQGRDRLLHIRCVVGSPFNDVLTGTGRDDLIQAGRGLDLVRTRAGNDFVNGGHEADEVHLGSGADTVLGLAGWDRLYGGRAPTSSPASRTATTSTEDPVTTTCTPARPARRAHLRHGPETTPHRTSSSAGPATIS